MPIRRQLLVYLLGVFVAACQSGTEGGRPSVEEDLAAIATARDALVSAIAQDDVDGIMAQLTADHLTMPPDGPAPNNNDALGEWHQARIDEFSFRSDFVTEDIQVRGDLAIERWSGASTLAARDGSAEIQDDTKGVWIWERQADGSWKLLWSIWNSSLP